MTDLENILNELRTNCGTTTAAWAEVLLKTALSKNITIAEWNNLVAHAGQESDDVQRVIAAIMAVIQLVGTEDRLAPGTSLTDAVNNTYQDVALIDLALGQLKDIVNTELATEEWVLEQLSSISVDVDAPTKVSELENDAGYITSGEAPVQSVNGEKGAVSLTAEDVGADKSGAAVTKVAEHNVDNESHKDVRLLIAGLADRLNALANSDDTTLDQMKEVVDYIKSNRGLIEQITTNKISYTDIIDNLTTNAAKKPLSAAQGVALKALIDAINVPTKVSELANDKGYLTSYIESDPTVPSWAKQPSKPSYTKNEVGLGNVDNVRQYSAENPPPYPVQSVNGKTGEIALTASDVGARPNAWTPTYSEVGADKSGTASNAVSGHNVDTESHNDIRAELQRLAGIIADVLDSDDATLNEMHEVVAYIKNNKTLIDAITTSKVNVTDIVNNLTTNVAGKPLSAAQGVALKALIDALATDKLDASALTNAINAALAQAKESGEFDGADGERGNGILNITTAPASYTTTTGGFTPVYRIALSTVISQSKVSKVLIGDTLAYSYYHYPVGYVDASYVYLATRQNIRGATGAAGTSVTITSVNESDESGGSNTVNFSNGTSLTVKNGRDGTDGKSAYAYAQESGYTGTESEYAEAINPDTINANSINFISTELAKRGQLKPEFAQSLADLEANGDTSLLYVLPDGYVYAYMCTEKLGAGYTNKLESATVSIDSDDVYENEQEGTKGYVTGVRLSSSGSVSTQDGMLTTGFIKAGVNEVLDGATIRTEGFTRYNAPLGCYVISYNSSGTKIAHFQWGVGTIGDSGDEYIPEFTLDSNTYGTGIKAIRISASSYTNPTIVTVNEEIKEPEIVKEYAWANTGHAFVSKNAIGVLRLSLPNQYYAVVGDTLEIFKKGLLEAYNTDNYDFKIYCEVGKNYKKRFVYTPTSSDAGKQYTFKVTVRDDYGNTVAEETSKIIVTTKASRPSVIKNVLCVGDSLLRGGEWAIEFHRRLTASGGTPVGDSIGNVNYIGTCEKNGVKFEGYGGWSFEAYNTEHKSSAFMWIACTHDKTEVDQHSVYKDSSNKNWKIETIESDRIKVICTSSTPSALTSGTLTWVSGGENHSDIVYTSAEQASGNPFWNETTGVVDFANYAAKQGVTSIDYLYVLLGWNSTGVAIETYKTQVETFIANVHRAFPSCKIVLMGLQIPSIDGLGENYGTWWDYMDKIKVVFDFNEMYKAIEEETHNVNFINIASQFDTEHGMPTGTRKVNVRSDIEETYGTNGVHPANSGYMQIADAVYRDLTYKLVNDYEEPEEPVIENLAIVNTTNTTDTSVWCNNYRVSSSGYIPQAGKSLSNIINCSAGDTIYVKGVVINESGDRLDFYSTGTGNYRQYPALCDSSIIAYSKENDVYKFEIKQPTAVSIRFTFDTPTDFDEVYITKQPIV